MKKTLSLVCTLISLVLSASALADSPNGGSDSCGLGWNVAPRKSLFSTSTRETTNYFLPPSFSMTSGTSGCARHSIVKNEQDAVIYLTTNFQPLSIEMAQGRGEYLDGMAKLMGCSDASMGAFDAMARSQFNQIMTAPTAYDAFSNIKSQVSKDPVLSKGCVI